MKTINPAGRLPNDPETNAYGCACTTLGTSPAPYSAVYSAGVPCYVCSFTCQAGNTYDRASCEAAAKNASNY